MSQVIERVRLGVQMKQPLTKRDLLLFINNTSQIEGSKRLVSRLLKNCVELVLKHVLWSVHELKSLKLN